MTTTLQPAPSVDQPSPPLAEPDHLLLCGISWEFYETTVRELEAAGSNVRVTYDEGRMEFVSPSPKHERVKGLIADLIKSYALERGIDCLPLGSVTCRRGDLRRGIEPDECFYVQHMPADPDELNLPADPPPDLAIEVDIFSRSIARQPIYAALGVPEIWRYHKRMIVILHRQPNGTYQPAVKSLAFPDLPIEVLQRYFDQALQGGAAQRRQALQGFQQWARRGNVM